MVVDPLALTATSLWRQTESTVSRPNVASNGSRRLLGLDPSGLDRVRTGVDRQRVPRTGTC